LPACAAALYELDGCVLLALTHSPTEAWLLGLRVGARIAVYNAHRVRCPRGGGGDGAWAVGACAATSFEILCFSPLDAPSRPRFRPACVCMYASHVTGM
jgi:hypothetical protein